VEHLAGLGEAARQEEIALHGPVAAVGRPGPGQAALPHRLQDAVQQRAGQGLVALQAPGVADPAAGMEGSIADGPAIGEGVEARGRVEVGAAQPAAHLIEGGRLELRQLAGRFVVDPDLGDLVPHLVGADGHVVLSRRARTPLPGPWYKGYVPTVRIASKVATMSASGSGEW